jgi:hypothetical protein
LYTAFNKLGRCDVVDSTSRTTTDDPDTTIEDFYSMEATISNVTARAKTSQDWIQSMAQNRKRNHDAEAKTDDATGTDENESVLRQHEEHILQLVTRCEFRSTGNRIGKLPDRLITTRTTITTQYLSYGSKFNISRAACKFRNNATGGCRVG